MGKKKTNKKPFGPGKVILSVVFGLIALIMFGAFMMVYQYLASATLSMIGVSIKGVLPAVVVNSLPFVAIAVAIIVSIMKSGRKKLDTLWQITFWFSSILVGIIIFYILGNINPLLGWSFYLLSMGTLGVIGLVGAMLSIITIGTSIVGLVMLNRYKKTVEPRHVLCLVMAIIAFIVFAPTTFYLNSQPRLEVGNTKYTISDPVDAGEWFFVNHSEYVDVAPSVQNCEIDTIGIQTKTLNGTSIDYIEVRTIPVEGYDDFTGIKSTKPRVFVLPLRHEERLLQEIEKYSQQGCDRSVKMIGLGV